MISFGIAAEQGTCIPGITVDFILDNLAIGSYHDALDPPAEITALLNVADEHDVSDSPLVNHKVAIVDMKSIPAAQLKEAVAWIIAHISDHKIMVFCHGGVGRSPSVVVAYLCCALDYGFGEAVEFVAIRKPRMVTLPNLILRIADIKRELQAAANA
jgi:protein-tyrosine phosphatase